MSKTSTVELHELQQNSSPKQGILQPPKTHHRIGHHSSHDEDYPQNERSLSQNEAAKPSSTVEEEPKPNWNYPKSNIVKVICCNYALLMMGLNDGAYGALIPYIETYYNLNYTIVSLIFLSPFVGYVIAALCNNAVHNKFGQRGVAVVSALSKLLAYTVICVHPPYPALVIIFGFAGFGIGLADAAWNAWIGDMRNANQILGILHACYGLGATLAPLIATSMITKGDLPWWTYYYFMIGMTFLELVACSTAFWTSTGEAFRATIAAASSSTDASNEIGSSNRSGLREALFRRPAARTTWLCCIFLFGYVGAEVALGGWIVTFMLRVRGGSAFSSGMTATGFWLGLTMGRLILGFVTPYIGEKLAIAIYLPASMALQLLFWLVPSFLLSAVFVSLEGFFLGPLFPAAVVVMSKLLPKHLHVSAIGFVVAFGGCGAAVFPFIVGSVAEATSVKSLQPLILGMLALILGAWVLLPRLKKRD